MDALMLDGIAEATAAKREAHLDSHLASRELKAPGLATSGLFDGRRISLFNSVASSSL